MAEPDFKPCALIPVYNHWLVLEETVRDLVTVGLPVILVDDGSDAHCKAVMASIAGQSPGACVVTRTTNGGKGAAVKDGLREAYRLGFSHALQIDSDGQHERRDVPRFLAAARHNRSALVYGCPVYDQSIPKVRLYGRYASRIWVWINTLSLEIRDAMCGFRVYPVAASCKLLDNAYFGDRMEFDVEILVRWHWSGAPVLGLDTAVTYPQDGISHFRMWRDNALVSFMHARLFFSALLRMPMLLVRRWKYSR